jgi:hypothetical protein
LPDGGSINSFSHKVDSPVPVRKRTSNCTCDLLIKIRHVLVLRLVADRNTSIAQPTQNLGLAPGDRSRTDRVFIRKVARLAVP